MALALRRAADAVMATSILRHAADVPTSESRHFASREDQWHSVHERYHPQDQRDAFWKFVSEGDIEPRR